MLFASKGMSHRLLVTATSGTAAARINGITIHSACNFSKDTTSRAGGYKSVDGIRLSSTSDLYINGQTRMNWQEKWLLIIDEVSMLGARTLYAVNEQLCKLRGCAQDFGGIPIVVFSGDFTSSAQSKNGPFFSQARAFLGTKNNHSERNKDTSTTGRTPCGRNSRR